MRFLALDDINELLKIFDFKKKGKIIENDLDVYTGIEDINKRKEKDALVLSTIAANLNKTKMLDIGTYKGKSASRMAINSPTSKIFTVNVLPEQISKGEKLITEALSKKEIGEFYKKRKIKNIEQFYKNTQTWNPPARVSNLSLSYIDGCHDKKAVYSDTNLVYDLTQKEGFILWHDFSPENRKNFSWINQSMFGVEKFFNKRKINGDIFYVKNSWIGIWKKK